MMWSGWDGWDLAWMLSFMVAFWGGLVWAIAALSRQFSGPRSTGGEEPAIDVLEQRFARGEIDEDEFQERRRILESKVTGR